MGEWNEYTKVICVSEIAFTKYSIKISIKAVLN